jgi:hypothetical protein
MCSRRQSQELRASTREIVWLVPKVIRRHTAFPFSQNKMGLTIARWYRRYFRIDGSGKVNRKGQIDTMMVAISMTSSQLITASWQNIFASS